MFGGAVNACLLSIRATDKLWLGLGEKPRTPPPPPPLTLTTPKIGGGHSGGLNPSYCAVHEPSA